MAAVLTLPASQPSEPMWCSFRSAPGAAIAAIEVVWASRPRFFAGQVLRVVSRHNRSKSQIPCNRFLRRAILVANIDGGVSYAVTGTLRLGESIPMNCFDHTEGRKRTYGIFLRSRTLAKTSSSGTASTGAITHTTGRRELRPRLRPATPGTSVNGLGKPCALRRIDRKS